MKIDRPGTFNLHNFVSYLLCRCMFTKTPVHAMVLLIFCFEVTQVPLLNYLLLIVGF